MARISTSLHLQPGEIDQIMSVEKRLRIATVGPGEDLNLKPMTFGWAAEKVYLFARGQKVANLRRQSRCTILVDTGEAWRELKGIMMRGSARVLEDASAETADEDLMSAQLNLGDKHNLMKNGVTEPYSQSASGKSRRWIVFTPEKVVSWNNNKLA